MVLRKEPRQVSSAHKVKGECKFCMFSDDTNSWCFYELSPMLVLGWETDQQYYSVSGSEYYFARFKVYAETQIWIQSRFDIKKLFYHEFSGELTKFKAFPFA